MMNSPPESVMSAVALTPLPVVFREKVPSEMLIVLPVTASSPEVRLVYVPPVMLTAALPLMQSSVELMS